MKSSDTESSLFLSCDWGTSRFRLSLIKSSDTVDSICSMSDSDGIKSVYDEWKSNGNEPQQDFFRNLLCQKISKLGEQSDRNLDELPVIISGMASSELGLKHLPYQSLPIPARATANNLNIHHMPANSTLKHDIYLISGLKTGDDIMRGEETLLLGAIEQHHVEEGILILPGTHSKHITITDGVIQHFDTYMTGELFELLSRYSILSKTIQEPNDWDNKKGFLDGLEDASQKELLSNLFKIRSASLLQNKKGNYNYFRLSGQLIGAELKHLLQIRPENIYIVGASKLLSLYDLAFRHYNISCNIIKRSEDLIAIGHLHILTSLQKKSI